MSELYPIKAALPTLVPALIYRITRRAQIMEGRTTDNQCGEYDNFFERIRNIQDIKNKQKGRGLNNYNIFTSLLKASDEVRLHSRFIFSLLNPDGDHYQGTLFLEKFIEAIGLADFGLNMDQAKVYKEYENIDLYITDGEKHIIIENKIWAEDQRCQVIGYVNKVVNGHDDGGTECDSEPSRINPSYIRVVYLTARNDKSTPDGHLVDSEGYIASDKKTLGEGLTNYRTKYHRVTYEAEIMDWLKTSQYEVSNLSNLSLFIEQYREVILRLHHKYRGKVMTLEQYLFDTKSDQTNTIRLALEIERDLITVKGRALYEFFRKLADELIGGKKGELYSDKEKEFGRPLCQGWVKRKKNGPRDFGVKWNLDGNVFVAVHAGISHLHVGIGCKTDKLGDNSTVSKLFGRHQFKDRGFWKSYYFSSYDLGMYRGINPEVILGLRNKEIINALEGLSQNTRLINVTPPSNPVSQSVY
jgi:hypothetical protein